MKAITRSSAVLAGLLASMLHVAPAWALKLWVAGNGNDGNPCTAAQPCASFLVAIARLPIGGEIGVLSPGDFGAAEIPYQISITNDGAGEATTPSLFITAGAGDVISLRGLVVDGQYAQAIGVEVSMASAVHIQNCVIRNVQQGSNNAHGIFLRSPFRTQIFVSDTLIYNNGSNQFSTGIIIPETLSGISLVLDRVHLENNVIGLEVERGGDGPAAQVVVRDSVVSGNASHGIYTRSTGSLPSFVVVEHSAVLNNGGTGILADGQHAIALLNGNSIKRNGAGINAINGGQLISYGNNRNNNNIGAEGAPTGLYGRM